MVSSVHEKTPKHGRPVWQVTRCRFNHDWLKNQYIQALGRWSRLLADETEDPDFERRFVAEVLPEWSDQERVVRALLADFEMTMSPRALFDRPPLKRCDAQTREWLPRLVHGLWLNRYPVRDWLGTAQACVAATDNAYATLSARLRDCRDTRSADAIRPFAPEFLRFEQACRNLASAIEKFPDRILVV